MSAIMSGEKASPSDVQMKIMRHDENAELRLKKSEKRRMELKEELKKQKDHYEWKLFKKDQEKNKLTQEIKKLKILLEQSGLIPDPEEPHKRMPRKSQWIFSPSTPKEHMEISEEFIVTNKNKKKGSKTKRVSAAKPVVIPEEAILEDTTHGPEEAMLDDFLPEDVTPSKKPKTGPEWRAIIKDVLKKEVDETGLNYPQESTENFVVIHIKKIGVSSPVALHVFSCSQCSHDMTNAATLAAHIESKHAQSSNSRLKSLNKLHCTFPLCEHSANKEDLIRHMRAKHTKEQLFRCDTCGKTFTSYATLKNHEGKHLYFNQCENCQRFCTERKCGSCKK